MMKTIYWISLTAILILMNACQQEADEQKLTDNSVDFQLRFQSQSDTRATAETPDSIFWHIFDNKGQRITHYKSMMKNENKSIFVEGLLDGEYSMLVVGKSSQVAKSKTKYLVPEKLDDLLLDFSDYQFTDTLPANIHYKLTRFTVVNGNRQQVNIDLQNVLARIDFNLQAKNSFLTASITSMKVTLNEATTAFMAANKTYVGERSVKNVDITKGHTLFMLPTQSGTVSGSLEVTAKLLGGQMHVSKYNFNVQVTEGAKSVVNINYTNSDAGLGVIHLPRSYYTKANSLTMLKDDESEDLIKDRSRRSFVVRTPLQFVVDKENKRLTMRFFSPTEIHDVKVFAKRRSDTEFFEVLQLDNVPAFIETYLPLDLLTKTVSYRTESGKYITITPPKEIVPSDYEFKVVCNDLFMQRVAKLRSNFRICFDIYDKKVAQYANAITPKQCRHCVSFILNLCYVFASDIFWEGVSTDRYYDSSGNRITVEKFQERLITNNQYIAFVRLTGKPGVAGGEMFGLDGGIMTINYADRAYFGAGMYVVYHEFAHSLGYGHEDSMAGKYPGDVGVQGSFTTFAYYDVFERLRKHNDIPVPFYNITESVVNEF